MKQTQRRNSKQRQIIFETVKASCKHPTAEEIYQTIKKDYPNISLGTVYRNLNLLCEQGDLVNLNSGFECDHFDGECSPHPHLICSECKRVFDLKADFAPLLGTISNEEFNAEIRCVRITAFGLCPSCKAEKEKQKNLCSKDAV